MDNLEPGQKLKMPLWNKQVYTFLGSDFPGLFLIQRDSDGKRYRVTRKYIEEHMKIVEGAIAA